MNELFAHQDTGIDAIRWKAAAVGRLRILGINLSCQGQVLSTKIDKTFCDTPI